MFGSADRTEAEEGRSRCPAEPAGAPNLEPSPGATAPAAGRRRSRSSDVNLYYGDFHAVEEVTMTIEPNKVTALIGSSGCGKTTFLRSLNRMHELTPGAQVKGDITLDGEDIYGNGVDPVAGAAADRDGLPAAEPVPDDVDLRQRRRRPQPQRRQRLEGRQGRGRRAQPARGPPLGRGQGPARQARLRPLRRPAAAALHRPRDRGRARGAADGRALLGARPGRHAGDRGPDRAS